MRLHNWHFDPVGADKAQLQVSTNVEIAGPVAGIRSVLCGIASGAHH
jgi:hypothetical protein